MIKHHLKKPFQSYEKRLSPRADHPVKEKRPDVTGEFIIRSVTEKENFLNSFLPHHLPSTSTGPWLTSP